MEVEVFENLQGSLRKLGVKGPRNSWKKRFFIQKPDSPSRLYYYVSQNAATPKGYINLEEAISVLRSTDSAKKNFNFQINTPRRIYQLRASNEQEMNYWIEGVASVIRRLNSAPGETESQLILELEQAGNRISDLESENAKLRRALQLAATELDLTFDEIMQQTESGASSLTRAKKEKNTNNVRETEKKDDKPIPQSQKKEKEVAESPEIVSEGVEETKEENQENRDVEAVEILEVAKDENKEESEEVEEEDEESESVESEIDTSGHFGATVKFDYEARKNYELSIKKDDIITVMSQHDNGWWLGCDSDGKQGYFPGSYVVAIEN